MISDAAVFIYLPGCLEAVPAGILTINQTGSELSSSFVYGRRYLERQDAIALDPVSLPINVGAWDRGVLAPVNDLP